MPAAATAKKRCRRQVVLFRLVLLALSLLYLYTTTQLTLIGSNHDVETTYGQAPNVEEIVLDYSASLLLAQPQNGTVALPLELQVHNLPKDAVPFRHSSTHPKDIPMIDIMSIGSLTRMDYLTAQRESFARHRTVRNFFPITEVNDDDPLCSWNLTRWNVKMISNWCRKKKKWNSKRQFVMSYLQTPYANKQWLMKKQNPAGWMCAQSRPLQGFYRVLQYYRSKGTLEVQDDKERILPDFLLVVDDDSYWNMPKLQEHLETNALYRDLSSDPIAMAGCRIRSPLPVINLTIPFGGFGILFSRGYLESVLRPIDCMQDPWLCQTIRRRSHMDERELFIQSLLTSNNDTSTTKQQSADTGAMPSPPRPWAIVDLMYRLATHQPYRSFRNWTSGFCFHSDWVWGIFTNFYNISRHNGENDARFNDVPQERLEAYLGSELDATDGSRSGICEMTGDKCTLDSHACHYTSPIQMKRLVTVSMEIYPGDYMQRP